MRVGAAEASEAASAFTGNESTEAFMNQRGPLARSCYTLSQFNQSFVEIDGRAHDSVRR